MLIEDAKRYGVTVSGNEREGRGSFKNFSGEFAVTGTQIVITVLATPIYAPKSVVESHVRKYINEKIRRAV
jgi:hypothetical protein